MLDEFFTSFIFLNVFNPFYVYLGILFFNGLNINVVSDSGISYHVLIDNSSDDSIIPKGSPLVMMFSSPKEWYESFLIASSIVTIVGRFSYSMMTLEAALWATA